jgi:1,4-dihydroxy-2-naphthoyl-CoA synthase
LRSKIPVILGEDDAVAFSIAASGEDLLGMNATASLAGVATPVAAAAPSAYASLARAGWGEQVLARLVTCQCIDARVPAMSGDYDTILVEHAGPVAILTLNRPDRVNALDRRMLMELGQALDRLEADTACRAVVVTGAGGNFSSGFDLKEQMATRPTGVGSWREILDSDFDTVMRFWHLANPTIAAVEGHCLAGACELALACDITIAAADAVFGEPELKFGAGIVVMILPWLVGPKRAKEIIFSGADRIPAP